MDKEGEQTPLGGIDLRGRLTVRRVAFCSAGTKSSVEKLFKPSQSTHCKTSLGLLPHNPLKGHPFSTPVGGVDDVTVIVKERGACTEPAGQFWRELLKI